MSQTAIPCKIYRGGTSRGIFFKESDLASFTPTQINQIIKQSIDANNPSQVDGLGGASSHTSKVIIIHDEIPAQYDLSYTFYQVGIGTNTVNNNGTCGNLMAAVGLYAVEEGYVEKKSNVKVNAYNVNINKTLEIEIDYSNPSLHQISGIHLSAEKINCNILYPGGSITGKTLPLGNITPLTINEKLFEVSFVDLINPFIYILSSAETQSLQFLDEIRVTLSAKAKVAPSIEEAKVILPIPKIATVEKAKDYVTTTGKIVKAAQYDIFSRMVSMNQFHKSYAGSGLYNLAASTLIPGTIPNKLVTLKKENTSVYTIKIGHPAGISLVNVQMDDNTKEILSVGIDRTARKIMDGVIYIPNFLLEE